MKMREKKEDMAISVRLNKEEWNVIKNQGDELFSNREVGYMQVIPNNFHFSTTSPFFKDMFELDSNNKEKSDEEKARDIQVHDEIKNKKR